MLLVSSCSCFRSIHWSQVLSWEWRCSWSSADRRCSNYIWVINNFIAYKGGTHIRGFTVMILNMSLLLRWIDPVLNKYRTTSRVNISSGHCPRDDQRLSTGGPWVVQRRTRPEDKQLAWSSCREHCRTKQSNYRCLIVTPGNSCHW